MSRLSRALAWGENAALGLGMALSTALILVQVVLRYGFNTGIPWAEELAVYAMIWTAFIAASAAMRTNGHLTVDLVLLLVGTRALAWIRRAGLVILVAFGLALATFGFQLVRQAMDFGQLSAGLQAPMWLVYLILPISGALVTLRAVMLLLARTEHAEPAARESEH